MELGLKGRTVIVTGASGGMGRRLVHGFAAEGADVVLTYHRGVAEAERLTKEIGDQVSAVPFDLADPDSAAAVVRHALDRTGRIDVLVNNAVRWGATTDAFDRPFEEVPDEEWLSVVRDNIEGAVRLSRAVAPSMKDRGWGRMVHVSSTLAVDGMAGAEYYAAAKAALHGFSRSAAFSLGRSGDVLSNVVVLGLTRPDTNTEIADAYGEHFAALTPIGRLIDADEVTRPVVFLASAANTGITGQIITVSGGA